MIKDSGFRVRVQRDLRARFLKICRMQDRAAAQVIREFMRAYVLQNSDAASGSPILKTRSQPSVRREKAKLRKQERGKKKGQGK